MAASRKEIELQNGKCLTEDMGEGAVRGREGTQGTKLV
jgi:hypothetical protein